VHRHFRSNAPHWNRVTNLFTYYISISTEPFLCLRRLAIDIDDFITLFTTDSIPLIHTVTHLEPLNTHEHFSYNPELAGCLACMSWLTHITFNLLPSNNVYSALCSNTHIRCIVCLGLDPGDLRRVRPLADDSRFVCIEQKIGFREDWLRGTDAGQDYWALAEAFIAARRSGTVDHEHTVWIRLVTVIHTSIGGQYSIADNNDSWNV
jgi:hypothetical protein